VYYMGSAEPKSTEHRWKGWCHQYLGYTCWKTTSVPTQHNWSAHDDRDMYVDDESDEDESESEDGHQGSWGNAPSSHPPSGSVNTSGWRGWSQEASGYSNLPQRTDPRPRASTSASLPQQRQSQGNSRNYVSPVQQNQILSSLLSQPGDSYAKMSQKYGTHTQSKTKQHHSQATDNGWGTTNGWEAGANDGDGGWGNSAAEGNGWGQTGWGNDENEEEEDEEWEDEFDVDGRRVHFSPRQSAGSAWPEMPKKTDSTYTVPSKTFAYASKGISTPLDPRVRRNTLQDYSNLNFTDSKGEALQPVKEALFGRGRRAAERIHWMFPPVRFGAVPFSIVSINRFF
jgi:hypothetical protein